MVVGQKLLTAVAFLVRFFILMGCVKTYHFATWGRVILSCKMSRCGFVVSKQRAVVAAGKNVCR